MAKPDCVASLAGRVRHCIAAPPVCRCLPCRSSCAVSRACLATTQQPSCLWARYNILYHDIVPQLGRARARCWLCRAFLSVVLQALPGHIMGVAGRVVAQPLAPLHCQALLCHDTISCIVTQHQTWAVAHPIAFLSRFFFSHHFFFSFQLLENLPIFFSISSKPNKFIEIYLIHFFFQFYTL